MIRYAVIAAALLIASLQGGGARANDGQAVTFPSLQPPGEPAVTLTGELYRPPGDSRQIGIVILPGCSGTEALHRQWARTWSAAGHAALIVDGFGPRGVEDVCSDPYKVNLVDRLEDAYGAKRYLAGLEGIDGDAIVLAGWSHGGWTLLRAVYSKFFRVPELIASDGAFAAAVAFYPYCDISAPAEIPMLVLIGGADDWTPKSLCDGAFAKAGASPLLDYHVYPGATHSFDDPFAADIPAIESWMATQPPGTVTLDPAGGYRYLGHLLRYDPAAHADAKLRVERFLERALRPK